ncbi:histidine kinase N-terminal 7TM domain-containing diguanylate cyclase [Chitinilyticum litopenaei]|uniref:histidine kinase N-terminal 7TM domain-containing diguanylate cyclase n=1 Tax=Chitinilyticum litopenaei TaxID=1121276 RepID=UPI0004123DB1|nr:histidine kinase N-terminal 7TM domain-containing protein [Chitinilyticum litopenaei]
MNAAALLLLAATLLTLGLAAHTWRRRLFPGKFHFIGMLLSASWWSGAAGLELALPGAAEKVLLAKLAWPGIVAAPSYWALFIWTYVKGDYRPPSPLWHAAMLLMPLFTVAIALSNDSHLLMYTATTPVSPAPGAAIRYSHGPWFYVCTLYLYGYMALSMLVIINALARATPLYRRHYLGFALAMALTWLSNAAHVSGLLLVFDFDPTPFSFLLMGAVFYWLISQRQLFDMHPVAHDILLDALPDAVLLIDDAQRIVQCNRAAAALPGLAPHPEGRRLADLPCLGALAPQLASGTPPLAGGLQIGEQHFDLHTAPVLYRQHAIGRLLLLRDISAHQKIQIELRQALQALEEQLDSNAALHARLREAAIRDALTGLYNRRFLEEVAPSLLAGAQRSGQALAVVMLDLDFFKRINDEHGHAAGDAVLVHLARLLQGAIRQSDFLFRLGGEEFLLLLPATSRELAVLRSAFWRTRLQQQQPSCNGRLLPVTFSAGVASYPDNGDTLDALLAMADLALYQAKAGGRNRSCSMPGADAAPENTPGGVLPA